MNRFKFVFFSEKYHFISYIDIFQPEALKYKIGFSHKLYEYCILSNIANNCNLYDHQTQLDFIEQRINYFLKEISFISRQARNILLPNPFFQKVTNLSSKLGNIMTYNDWHNSQKDPNIHLYRILAKNWLKDLA